MQKTIYSIVLLWVILVWSHPTLFAQKHTHTIDLKSFGVGEGLLHRQVEVIFESKEGFLWIGSVKGLQRYDGYEFKSWTKSNSARKIYNITAINQDQAGWLWLWNNALNQFVFLHPLTEEILNEEERFPEGFPIHREVGEPSIWYNSNRNLNIDKDGNLVFVLSSPAQIIRYDVNKGFQKTLIEGEDIVMLRVIDKAGNLWMTNLNHELLMISPTGKILKRYALEKSKRFFMWVASDGSIYYYLSEQDNTNLRFFKIKNGAATFLTQKKSRGLFSFDLDEAHWTLVENGWEVQNLESGAIETFVDPTVNDNPFLKKLSFAYQDRQQRLWLAGEYGLNLLTFRKSHFTNYYSFKENETKPTNNSARGILANGDTIFANFEFGGFFKMPKNDPTKWIHLSPNIPPREYEARPLIKDTEGKILSGHSYQLFTYDESGKETVIHSFEKWGRDLPIDIWSFFQTKEGRVWLGMTKSLGYKNPDDDQLHYFSTNEKNSELYQEINNGMVLQIRPINDSLMWLCASTGLFLFDFKNEKLLKKYNSQEKEDAYLPADCFYYMHIDEEGVHWIGTNEGLIRWEKENGKWEVFSRKDGFPNDVIYAVFEDDYQNLWMSSDRGIICFNKETHRVKTYLRKDGLPHEEFNRIAHFQEQDGTIYFGGLNGITAFHPKSFLEENENQFSQLVVTNLSQFDGAQNVLVDKTTNLYTKNEIVLRPEDRFFRLQFSLLTFDEMELNAYKWMVEGVDENWNFQNENEIQLGRLPYGDHTLKIKGQNAAGQWSPHELSILVKVLKPIYLQVWFLFSLSALAILGLLTFYRWRTMRYQRQQKVLEQAISRATQKIKTDKRIIEQQTEELRHLDKVKSRFFANVSHELRTPLTLMLGPINSVLKGNNLGNKDFTFLKTAQQSGVELNKLINSILDLSKMDASKLELNEQPHRLYDLTSRMASVFGAHAEALGVVFLFENKIEENIRLEYDENKVEVILNNLLSNALKFTSTEGKVIFKITDQKNAILITVQDSGRGIHPEDLPHIFDRFYQSSQPDAPTEGGTGIGLAIVQEFVKMMGGKVWVESELGKGTHFFVKLPRKEVFGKINETTKVETATAFFQNSSHQNDTESATEDFNETKRILVVEDHYNLRHYLKTILAPNYQIQLAENGQIALDILNSDTHQKEPFHLVLSDVMMPGMDGYQLLEAMRADERFNHIPVIILTARADIQDKLKAFRIGVDDYILKPFEEEELVTRIQNLLERSVQRMWMDEEGEEALLASTDVISDADLEWQKDLENLILERISDSRFNIEFLSKELAMSRRQLQRRIKKLVGLTPKEYVNEIRLHEARRLLEMGKFNSVKEVSHQMGFANPDYFSNRFKERFGRSPSFFLS